MLKQIEIVADYWIIEDNRTYTEYADSKGDNYMFETKQEALDFIKGLKMNTLEQYITDALLNEYANTRDKAILLADTLEVSINSSKWEALEQLVIDCCDTKGIKINWFE
jgi:hypothetical protein